MKVTQDNGPALISNACGEEIDIRFGDSIAAQAMMMHVVTSKIYTRKEEAVWREYGCNAADANIEAGRADSPIEITLPTKSNAEAVIRDFGPGITHERMIDVYCRPGESTKRDSNAVTGMIGIGAKAGWAYGEMFTVISFIGGMKSTYQFYKNKGRPKMMPMGTEPTDAPDGTEIRVPVRADDMETFRAAAEKTFRYFKVSPIVYGGTLDYQRGHPVFKGSDWNLTGDQKPVAIMGNVGYEIDVESLGLEYDCNAAQLLDIGIELHFEIGELEIAASREGLEYKEGTKQVVGAKATRVIAELASIFKTQIANAPNLWEAKKAYADAFEKMGSGEKQTLRDLLDGHVTWNGEKMENGRFELIVDASIATLMRINAYTKDWRGRVRGDSNCDNVIPHDSLTIAVNDLPKLNVPQSRVKGHFSKHIEAHNLVVLTFHTTAAKDKFWADSKMDGVPTVALSTLPRLLTANGSSYTPRVHRTKHSARAFVLDETASTFRRKSQARSAWWTVENADRASGKGVYVVIGKFCAEHPLKGDVIEPEELLSDVKRLRSRSLISGPVYAFKRKSDGSLPKLGPGWVPLKDHVIAEVKDWVANHAQRIADYEESVEHSTLLPLRLAPLLPDCLAKELIETREQMHSGAGSHGTLANFIRDGRCSDWVPGKLLELPEPTVDLGAMQEKVLERYPMLNYYDRHSSSEKTLTNLSEYIKLVERQ